MPGVRDGDTLADPGRAEFLASEDGTDDALEVGLAELAGPVKATDNLADRPLFAGRREVDQDRVTHHEIRKLHPIRSSIPRAEGRASEPVRGRATTPRPIRPYRPGQPFPS